ncbi:lipopolysaccharide biosynthesis protein [Flavobacterium granuli]|uniref:O-antigen/teichoic acid export membrane protein n=1 Tax=Flavobacterium granuli TaxID=280093 RepID=A0ABU1S5T4_9FLAO|nr:lipopolysaccharide biosynthesis protein [Flavobacterium granuli]MDR6846396.1 O-antigen/teichoic acid export membrane protein [Flavobacterium granuli]
MKELIKAFLIFGLATSIEGLLGFTLLPIYTRYFTKVEYGVIDMVGVILAIATIFGVLQIETALQRYYYESTGVRRKMLTFNVFFFVFFASFFVSTLLYFFAPLLANLLFDNYRYENLIRIACFQLPLINLSVLGLIILRFEKQNLKFLIIIVVKVLTSLLSVFLFVIYNKMGIKGVFLAQLLALVFSSSLLFWFVKKYFCFRYSNIIIKKTLTYALPQIPARIGSILMSQANRFFMLSFLSLSAIGLYSVSLKLSSGIQLFYSAFVMAWRPFMFDKFKNENNKIIFSSVLPIMSSFIFLLVSFISLFSHEIFVLMTSKEFYEGHKYIGGLSLYFALFLIKEVVDIGPVIKEKTKFLSYTFFLTLFISFIILYVLIQVDGLRGVVISLLISNLILMIFSWIVSNYLYYIPFNKVHFLILFLPVFSLSVISMYLEISFLFRMILVISVTFFYLISLIFFVRKYLSIK